MSETKKFLVVREHGDFAEGTIREVDPSTVAHLVPHCLEPSKGEKAEPVLQNKAESAAPANKAAIGRKAKRAG